MTLIVIASCSQEKKDVLCQILSRNPIYLIVNADYSTNEMYIILLLFL